MAYPVIDDVAQVQVRMQKSSGLPEDVMVNTFYFRIQALATLAENAASMADMLNAFYGDTFGGLSGAIKDAIPSYFTSVRYVFYDLGQSTPRYPVTPDGGVDPFIEASWLPGAPQSTTLPEEVALCLSFRAGQGPRRRGRVFIGPIADAYCETVNGAARPTLELRNRLALAGTDLMNSTENSTWLMCSPTDAGAWDVEGGWVDNAWDTLRSRGAAPDSRITWPAAV